MGKFHRVSGLSGQSDPISDAMGVQVSADATGGGEFKKLALPDLLCMSQSIGAPAAARIGVSQLPDVAFPAGNLRLYRVAGSVANQAETVITAVAGMENDQSVKIFHSVRV